MAEDDSYDQLYKIILIGDASVGKSNILSRYLSNVFKQDTKSTVGVEFGSKKVSVNGVNIKLQIWDTAGQERYRAITSAYYKGSKGCLIVYDITSEKSFEDVEKWYEEINKTAGKDICVVLVGNKCDLESERKVSTEMGENKAKNLGFAFFETSALNNIQIGKVFEVITEEIFNKFKNEKNDDDDDDYDIIQENKPTTINTDEKPKQQNCC
jgi:Ras-related protein Rab-11A